MAFKPTIGDQTRINTKWIVRSVVGVVIIVGAFLLGPWTTVGPGQRGVLMNFGAVQNGILQPGLHPIIPIVQTVHNYDVRIQKYEKEEEASSHDLQDVFTTIAVTYHVDPIDVNRIYQTVGDLDAVNSKIIQPAADNAIKAITAHYDVSDLIGRRDQVALDTFNLLKVALNEQHVVMDAVNITNFRLGTEFSHSIEQKQIAQQQSLQAQYELDKQRVDVQRKVLEANAESQARVAQAKGEAEATELHAKAQADANNLLNATLTDKILQQRTLDRWNGVLPVYMGNGPVPFVNVQGK